MSLSKIQKGSEPLVSQKATLSKTTKEIGQIWHTCIDGAEFDKTIECHCFKRWLPLDETKKEIEEKMIKIIQTNRRGLTAEDMINIIHEVLR